MMGRGGMWVGEQRAASAAYVRNGMMVPYADLTTAGRMGGQMAKSMGHSSHYGEIDGA